jgi:hypothetical protein
MMNLVRQWSQEVASLARLNLEVGDTNSPVDFRQNQPNASAWSLIN